MLNLLVLRTRTLPEDAITSGAIAGGKVSVLPAFLNDAAIESRHW